MAPTWEENLRASTARGANVVPGVVLAAINKKGELIYNETSGYQSMAPDAPEIDPNGVFWIASCTKLLASVCALQCVEQGLVTLDEPVSRILPELASSDVLTVDPSAPNGFTLAPAKNPVTLRTLLTHTSGVGYEWMSPPLSLWRKTQPPIPEEKRGKTATTYNLPLLFEPGEGWVYGGGLDWAGEMVARLHKTTLGEYMDKVMFKPFGMKSTTFHLDQRPDLKERLVLAGKRNADGTLSENPGMVFAEKVNDDSGGGGLWSTVPDYIKVLGDLLKDEPTLLKKETVESMLTHPQITNDAALGALVKARSIAGANAAPASFGMNYGLGGLLMTKDTPILPIGSLSWGGLPNLKWFINREYGVAAMYASQVLPPGDPKSTKLSAEFFQEVIRLAKESK